MGLAVALLAVALIILALTVLPMRRRIDVLERERAERILREEARLRQMTSSRNGGRNGSPPPRRDRKHLRYIRGGAAVGALLASAAAVRDWWGSHRPVGYTLAAGAAAVTFGAAVYLVDDGRGTMGQQPPVTGPSASAPPIETLTPGTPSRTPEDETSRSRPGRSMAPGPSATAVLPNIPSPNGGADAAPPGDAGDDEGPSGDAVTEPPASTPPPKDDSPPGPTPTQERGPDSLLCLQAALTPLLTVDACLS